MSKRKDRHQSQTLFTQLRARAASLESDSASENSHGKELSDEVLASSVSLSPLLEHPVARDLPRMKKFRFQLLHAWLLDHVKPCRVADIGGGKGLLAYLLQQSGWSATVIDPVHQALPSKYKDLAMDRQIHTPATAQVPHIDQAFAPSMAQHFDLLVAIHAHGCTLQVIDAAAQHGCSFILLPCCVIGEPMVPLPGVHWIQFVADYAVAQRFVLQPFRLNFKGQNIGLYANRIQK